MQKKEEQIREYLYLRLQNEFNKREWKKELKHLPKYEHFLWLIYRNQYSVDTYVPLSNRLLTKVIRQEMITKIKRNLIDELKWVECDFIKEFANENGCIKGIRPYGYRLTDNLYNDIANHQGKDTPGVSDKEKKRKEEFEKKIKKASITRWDDLVKLPQKPEYGYIEENAKKIKISPEAHDWIDSQIGNLKLKPRRVHYHDSLTGKEKSYCKKNIMLDQRIAETWKQHVCKLEHEDYSFKCPSTVDRVFYNLTSLPTELRQFLKYKGEPLYNLDYSNFQPFLFVKLLKEKYGDNLPADVERYITLTAQGKFYNEVKRLIEEAGIEIKNKNQFKIDFFARAFFSTEKVNYQYRQVFAEHFPNVSACITETKKDDYRDLAIKLQKLEAKIVINTILRQLACFHNDLLVLPIHDALICERDAIDIVRDLMLGAAKVEIGYLPTVKEEWLMPVPDSFELQLTEFLAKPENASGMDDKNEPDKLTSEEEELYAAYLWEEEERFMYEHNITWEEQIMFN